MTNFFGEVYGQIGSIWRKLSAGQKTLIVFVSVAVLAGVAGVVYWNSGLEMGVLFGNLDPKDAGAIQSKLEEDGVPFELKDGGRTLLVPRQRVYELRNRLTQEGLIQGEGQGMEIFDDLQLGMTEFLQDVNLTRAIEGELARTIAWLDPVAAAKVHVNRPKPTIFTELKAPPAATVVLRLVPGRTLSGQQMLGIANIVASAVEGLAPENVKIVDEMGRLLSKTPSDYEGEMGTGQLEIKRNFEDALTRKVQEQLDGVVGPDKVRVVINVELDLQKQTRRETKYSYPEEGKVVKTEKVNTTDSSKTSPSEGAATGMESKLAGGTTAEASGTPERSSSEDSEREYAVNTMEQDIIDGGATISRISFAAMIDQSLQDKAQDIEKIIKQAVGFSDERGDSSTTAIIEFNRPEAVDNEEALDSFERKEFILKLVRHGIEGLCVAGVIVVLFLVLRRTERRSAQGGPREARPRMAAPTQEATPETVDRSRVREEVLAAVQADPIMATDILHEWLKEE